jgi:DNA invertase Pin-like site-specific DNA recombinase
MLSLDRQVDDDLSKDHAIYLRVSTKRQDTVSQEPELKRWAESHEGDSRWYYDKELMEFLRKQ